MSKQNTIEIECPSCQGTGVYRGFAEPQGVAVVCLHCEGTGKETITYKPFTGRKRRDGIHTVRLSAGTLLVTGVGPRGGSVTYEEFLAGKVPRR
jgi:hypothetical protein